MKLYTKYAIFFFVMVSGFGCTEVRAAGDLPEQRNREAAGLAEGQGQNEVEALHMGLNMQGWLDGAGAINPRRLVSGGVSFVQEGARSRLADLHHAGAMLSQGIAVVGSGVGRDAARVGLRVREGAALVGARAINRIIPASVQQFPGAVIQAARIVNQIIGDVGAVAASARVVADSSARLFQRVEAPFNEALGGVRHRQVEEAAAADEDAKEEEEKIQAQAGERNDQEPQDIAALLRVCARQAQIIRRAEPSRQGQEPGQNLGFGQNLVDACALIGDRVNDLAELRRGKPGDGAILNQAFHDVMRGFASVVQGARGAGEAPVQAGEAPAQAAEAAAGGLGHQLGADLGIIARVVARGVGRFAAAVAPGQAGDGQAVGPAAVAQADLGAQFAHEAIRLLHNAGDAVAAGGRAAEQAGQAAAGVRSFLNPDGDQAAQAARRAFVKEVQGAVTDGLRQGGDTLSAKYPLVIPAIVCSLGAVATYFGQKTWKELGGRKGILNSFKLFIRDILSDVTGRDHDAKDKEDAAKKRSNLDSGDQELSDDADKVDSTEKINNAHKTKDTARAIAGVVKSVAADKKVKKIEKSLFGRIASWFTTRDTVSQGSALA